MAARLAQIKSGLRRYGLQAAIFLANFGISKSLSFVGPLVLAALLAPDVYGSIELAVSIAIIGAMVLGLGIPLAVPQLSLLRRQVAVIDLLALITAASGAVLLFAAAVLYAGSSATGSLICLASIVAVGQGVLTVYFRTFSWRNCAVWASSLALITALAVGVLSHLFASPDIPTINVGYSVAGLAITLIALVVARRSRAPNISGRLRLAVRTGLPMMAYALATVWLAVSGRVLIGSLLSTHAVALYAFDFRIASLVLIVHGVLATGLFSRMYTMRTRPYDRFASAYLLCVAALCLALVIAYPFVLPHLPTRAIEPAQRGLAIAIFPVVALQIFALNVAASLELRLNRARLAHKGSIAVGTVAVLAFSGMLLLHTAELLTLPLATYILSGQMIAVVATQLFLLARKGLVMPRTSAACAVSFCVLSAAAFVF